MATVINKVRNADFLSELEYSDRLEAERIIDKGAEVALLHFWFNLITGKYFGLLPLEKVWIDADRFSKKYPEFAEDILKWFRRYEKLIGV